VLPALGRQSGSDPIFLFVSMRVPSITFGGLADWVWLSRWQSHKRTKGAVARPSFLRKLKTACALMAAVDRGKSHLEHMSFRSANSRLTEAAVTSGARLAFVSHS
jgi:hypothetical protein